MEKIFYHRFEVPEAEGKPVILTVTDSLNRICYLEINSVGRVFVRQEKI